MKPVSLSLLSLVLFSANGIICSSSAGSTSRFPRLEKLGNLAYEHGSSLFSVLQNLVSPAQPAVIVQPKVHSFSVDSFNSFAYDKTPVKAFLDSIVINKDRKIDEIFILTINQKDAGNNTVATKQIRFNLLHKMLEAAVESNNEVRAQMLLTKKSLVKSLSDIQKVQILQKAIRNLELIFVPANRADLYKILGKLVEKEFYISNEDLKARGEMVHGWDCPLYPIIADPAASAIFLAKDADIFKKEKNCNYLKQAIVDSDFKTIDEALKINYNAGAIDADGRNALDEINSQIECKAVVLPENATLYEPSHIDACKSVELYRAELIKKLKDAGVNPAFTKKNLERNLKDKRFDLLEEILTLGQADEEFKKPAMIKFIIEKSLETKNKKFILKVLDLYLKNLTFVQIMELQVKHFDDIDKDKDIADIFTKVLASKA